MSEATKARWDDPAARERMITQVRAMSADPVSRQKKASATRKRWADPAAREKMIAGMRAAGDRRRNKDTAELLEAERLERSHGGSKKEETLVLSRDLSIPIGPLVNQNLTN